MIGTTSRPSQIDRRLSQVLAPRYDFAPCTIFEMGQLVTKFMGYCLVLIQPDAAELIGKYCEGSPGKANVLVRRVADFFWVNPVPFAHPVTMELVQRALTYLGYSQIPESYTELEQKLNIMNGIEFEEFIAKFFRNKGYIVELTSATGDHGIDLLIKKDHDYIAVQCKRWAKPVGEPTIRDFYGSLLNAGAKSGYVIATSGLQSKYQISRRENQSGWLAWKN